MPNRVHVLRVSDAERAELERRARDRGALARDVAWARIVLLSSQGLPGPEIAERMRLHAGAPLNYLRTRRVRSSRGSENVRVSSAVLISSTSVQPRCPR